jgi:hypothetical protein
MNKLTVKLENCYGIKSLEAEFDFSKDPVYAIYAPNGAMKSSFAKTFRDVSENVASSDRIFPKRACARSIKDETGKELDGASIFVVAPYDQEFGQTEKTSTLLVDNKLRKDYESLHEALNAVEARFLAAMKEASSSKRNLKNEISSAFTRSGDFYAALSRVQNEVRDQKDSPWVGVQYDVLFDDKVLKVLAKKEVKDVIADYVTQYNRLIAESTYFKRGVFNYYDAESIAKQLASHGFFEARHTVLLNADAPLEITSQKQLEEVIQKEKDHITNDPSLKKQFAALEKQLMANAECRLFRDYLDERQDLVPKLANIEGLREEIWKSYLKDKQELYEELLSEHQKAQARKKEIEAAAAKQRTQWEAVIDIFNDRFSVPFQLIPKNKIQVMLEGEPVLSLGFLFHDGEERATVEEDTLMQALSTGEKKALYVLNIIFEMEVRKKAGIPTLFVFDDIADSFDYKNKYAIIQYLDDIAQEAPFCQIILTHNFDFYRTLESRFVSYSHCLVAFKADGKLSLEQATGIKNVFVNDWKAAFFTDPRKRIASIPFIRNLIEYTSGEDDPDYGRLTSLLHWRPDTQTLTQEYLDTVYWTVFGKNDKQWKDKKSVVVDDIETEATKCLTAGSGFNFENKIVLAIAIRLTAERYMASRINDAKFLGGIKGNQTQKLLSRFKKDFPKEEVTIRTLSRVVLMTPENIHLNSFMYEPIIDMSDDHLRKLLKELRELTTAPVAKAVKSPSKAGSSASPALT